MNKVADVSDSVKKAAKRSATWSIGIFTGPDLLNLVPEPNASMPVLSAQDVTDIRAQFVADPFMIRSGNSWHMFFEVMNAESRKGDIGLASSDDGFRWHYRRIVLTEPFHLSYPCVFSLDGEYYMIPESYEANAIQLYRADPFPTRWSLVRRILEGPWVDSSIFHFKGRWWLFSNPLAPENQVLELFHAENIHGPWQRHPMSPIVSGSNRFARSGGRVIVAGDKVIRFTQDCFPFYGTAVRAFEVSGLTTSDYSEREFEKSPILTAGREFWRQEGMHHIDAHSVNGRWLACVDGWSFDPPRSTSV